jgi:hypothetical protein
VDGRDATGTARRVTGGGGGARARRRRPRRRLSGRQALAVAFALVVLLAAAAIAGAAAKDYLRPRPYPPQVLYTSGKIKMSNSRSGAAIVSAKRMQPGDTVRGTVVIRNHSKQRARFWLTPRRVVDVPGPQGGELSRRLVLYVVQVNNGRVGTRPSRVLYRGTIAGMPAIPLGAFRPGRRVTYRFVVTFPMEDRAVPDNVFQGSSVRVDFLWRAARLR